MFADINYFVNEYQGIDIEEKELEKLIKRANRDIDLLTNGRIVFEKLLEIDKERVRNAVCSQVEFLYSNGELSSSGGSSDSFSIGQYSESTNSYVQSRNKNPYFSRYSPMVFEYLKLTGLLYGYLYERVDYV